MGAEKKENLLLKTFYSRKMNFFRFSGAFFVTLGLLTGLGIWLEYFGQIFFAALVGIFLLIGLLFLIAGYLLYERIDSLNANLLALLHYNSHYIFRFLKKRRSHDRRIWPVCLLVTAILVLFSLLALLNEHTKPLTLYLLAGAGAFLLLSFILMPFFYGFFQRVWLYVSGGGREVILSRNGAVIQGRYYNFQSRLFSLLRCDFREMGVFQMLVFVCQLQRGFQTVIWELPVPLPDDFPKEQTERLLKLYNDKELLETIAAPKAPE